jgi:hypothetical protein
MTLRFENNKDQQIIFKFAADLGEQILGSNRDQQYDAKLVQSLSQDMQKRYPAEYAVLQNQTKQTMIDLVQMYQEEFEKMGQHLKKNVAWASVAAGLLLNCYNSNMLKWSELITCLKSKNATQLRFVLAQWIADFGLDVALCQLLPIDTLGHVKNMWDDKTKDNVPIPKQDYNISPTLANKWINGPGSLRDKQYRAQFVKEIVYISFPMFLQLLKQSANSFMHQIQNEPYIISLTVTMLGYTPHKSAEWLVALCKAYIPDFPRPTEIAIDQKELIKYLKDIPKTEGMCQINILFVDDISFSGQQLGTAIQLVHDVLKEFLFVSINLHIIVPIISVIGQEQVQKVIDRYKSDRFHIFLHTAKTVPKFSQDVIDRFDLRKSAASALYSAHKLPDWLSVPNTMIAPLISNCEQYYIDQYGYPKEFNTQNPPCPWPPYKPEVNRYFKKP